MIANREIRDALVGSWRLLLGEERGVAGFDVSIGGFWRSFAVMLLLLPVPVVDLLAQRRLPLAPGLDPADLSGPGYWIVGLLAYALSWIAFPLILVPLAGLVGISRRYVAYMVARNWSTVLATAPSFVFTVGFALGLLPLSVLAPLNLAGFAFGLVCSWQVTRLVCAVPGGLAAGLVVLDTLLSVVIYAGADRLMGL